MHTCVHQVDRTRPAVWVFFKKPKQTKPRGRYFPKSLHVTPVKERARWVPTDYPARGRVLTQLEGVASRGSLIILVALQGERRNADVKV